MQIRSFPIYDRVQASILVRVVGDLSPEVVNQIMVLLLESQPLLQPRELLRYPPQLVLQPLNFPLMLMDLIELLVRALRLLHNYCVQPFILSAQHQVFALQLLQRELRLLRLQSGFCGVALEPRLVELLLCGAQRLAELVDLICLVRDVLLKLQIELFQNVVLLVLLALDKLHLLVDGLQGVADFLVLQVLLLQMLLELEDLLVLCG